MIELIPPTNFDDALVTEFKALGIKEVYGKLAIDALGGGRFASGLPNVSRKRLVRHVKKLSDAGIDFNYILNAPCFSSREFTRSGRSSLRRLLDWLVVNGVRKVTVTIPYILQLIKDAYPDFKVSVSTYAQVDSCQKARYWQEIGADEITLLDTCLNRNFKLLKSIRSGIKVKLRLIGNTSCLPHCHLFQYHALLSAHGSQTAYSNKAGFAVDYCAIYCKYLRLANPVNFIYSQWIRPEDLGIYEEAGIDAIKLIDRRCSTATLINITRSYQKRSYDGNLLDLLPAFQGKSPKNPGNLLLKIKYYFHPLESNIFKIMELDKRMNGLDIYIDNAKLNGFIAGLKEKDCSYSSCPECGYCHKVASEAIRYDKDYLEKTARTYKSILDNIIQGKI
jgi:collagenase-like PrtC family protease